MKLPPHRRPQLDVRALDPDLDTHPECRDMRLVCRLARVFAGIWEDCPPGLDVDDLVQIGYLTLLRCHRVYTTGPPRDVPYSRYVALALKRSMSEAITQGKCLIHIPPCAHRLANQLDEGKPLDLGDGQHGRRLRTAKQAQRIRRMERRQLDNDLRVLATGLDTKWIDLEALRHNLARLSERERLVLRLRYGLDDPAGEMKTFAQVGAEAWEGKKVSRQGARCAAASALERLRELLGVPG